MIVKPIVEKTLPLFSGRKTELQELDFLIKTYSIAIIEGNFGIGKTSLGNYYRLSNNFITPENEISTDFRWSTKDFLHEIIKSILHSLVKEKGIDKEPIVQELVRRYYYLLSEITSFPIFEAILKTEKTETPPEIETVSGLQTDLKKLAIFTEDKLKKPLLVQLNNLDITSEDSEKELISFFSINRNVFQLSNIKWILTGGVGLKNVLQDKLSKMGSLTLEPIVLEFLDKYSILDTLEKRQLTIFDKKHMLALCRESDLRLLLNNLTYLKENPSKKTLDISLLTPREKELVSTFGDGEYSPEELINMWKVSQGDVSKKTKSLEQKKWIVKIKNKYSLSFYGYYSACIVGVV